MTWKFDKRGNRFGFLKFYDVINVKEIKHVKLGGW